MKYTGCSTAEAQQEVERLLIHPVNQSCSPIYICPSYQGPPSLQVLRPTRPGLQETSGPTWEVVSFSGMGGDCRNPPHGFPPHLLKPPQLPGQNPIGHVTLLPDQNVLD